MWENLLQVQSIELSRKRLREYVRLVGDISSIFLTQQSVSNYDVCAVLTETNFDNVITLIKSSIILFCQFGGYWGNFPDLR